MRAMKQGENVLAVIESLEISSAGGGAVVPFYTSSVCVGCEGRPAVHHRSQLLKHCTGQLSI